MNREERNIGSIIIFILIILVIGIGGYFLVIKNNSNNHGNNDNNNKTSIKIDEDKSYIYFTNQEYIENVEGLEYKDININIDTNEAKKLQETLNQEMKDIKNEVEKNDKGEIVTAKMIAYETAETSKYLSLIQNKYTHKSEEDDENEAISESVINCYVFDLNNGHILTNRDILRNENVTDQEIRTKIREYISNDNNIDIDATLNNDYSLTISKTGNIVINTIVKSLNSNYNVSIEMD